MAQALTTVLAAMAMAIAIALAGGAALAADEKLVDLGKDTFAKADKTPDGGQALKLDMGKRRTNWNKAEWSVAELAAGRDLTGYNAVKIVVTTDKPRADAGVYIALREGGGAWWAFNRAVDLTRKENTGIVRFDDFRQCEWYAPPSGTHHDATGLFERDKVAAVAVGCVNPMGVGEVAFTVREISLVKLPEAPAAAAKVDVTGKMLAVGSQQFIPAATFGVYYPHQLPISKYRLAMQRNLGGPRPADAVTHVQLGCFGERTTPSPRLRKGWEEAMAAAAKGYVDAAKKTGQRLYAEFWNEPYLNWSNYTRKNYDPQFFDVDKAAEDGPVTLKDTGETLAFLKWTKVYDKPLYNWFEKKEWRRAQDEKGKLIPAGYGKPAPWSAGARKEWAAAPWPPENVKDGETYEVADKAGKVAKYKAVTPWHVYDETQFAYWSGRSQVKLYCEPALAFGKALKAGDPNSMYFVGWGFRPGEDHWAGWDMLYKPTLDQLISVADGMHEHDYGGDPLKLPANYEVMYAYAMTRYNKPLVFINTEQAAQTDPQAYPEAERQQSDDRNKFQWTARKQMLALSAMPDKAFGICHFGQWASDSGEGVMFRMLINLRGRLVHVACDDPEMFVVAAVDGADPRNPRPDYLPKRKELVVAAWNDRVAARELALNVAAPAGLKFTGEATIRRVGSEMVTPPGKTPKDPPGAPVKSLGVAEEAAKTAGATFTLKETLAPRTLVVVTLPVEGDVPAGPQVRRSQFCGRAIVAQVTPAASVEETIAIDPAVLKGARRAWIRFVAQYLNEDAGTVTLNGKEIKLPSCLPPENASWLRDVPVQTADLKARNTLVFKLADAGRAGFLLCTDSVIVEHE